MLYFSVPASGELCDLWGQSAAGWRGHQRPGSYTHPGAGGQHMTHVLSLSFYEADVCAKTSSSMSFYQQIPDILRVGAKRYFGQTALGGPFHVIL